MRIFIMILILSTLCPFNFADDQATEANEKVAENPKEEEKIPPELIFLKNGDRYTALVVGFDVENNALMLESEQAGAISIPWEQIKSIESQRMLYFRMENGNVVQGQATGLQGNSFVIVSPLMGKITVLREQVLMIAPEEEGISPEYTDLMKKYEETQEALRKATEIGELWSGYLKSSFSGNEGNKNDRTLSATAHLERKTEFDRFTAHMDMRYTSSRRVKTTSQISGFLKEDLDMNSWLYLWGQLSGKWDEILGIKLLFRAELGVGFHLIKPGEAELFKGDEISLRWEIGGQFSNTDYDTSTDTHTGGMVTRLIYTHLFTLPVSWLRGPKPWKLEILGEYYVSFVKPQNRPDAGQTDDYALKGVISLTVPFTDVFDFSIRVWDEYTNITDQADQRRNDFYWDIGLGISF